MDHEEFIDVLDHIEQLLYKELYDSYIICGDFNTSFERNNAHTEYLNGFMSRNNLMCVWNHPSSTVNDTYVNLDLNHRSCIDHFLVSMNIFHAVLRSYVVEPVDNHSHHHPGYIAISPCMPLILAP